MAGRGQTVCREPGCGAPIMLVRKWSLDDVESAIERQAERLADVNVTDLTVRADA